MPDDESRKEVLTVFQIDTMPTRSANVAPLTNVLSISTAGRNRYLLHFNSYHSLVQWTAGIRLCMFEHSKLQEIYTGALIAAKGKDLNAIGQITERARFKYEEWVKVRFGAGTPWRRCWVVVTPPDEKATKKARAQAKKDGKSYEPPTSKGEIRFYDSKKTKKHTPIATIVDAFAAYSLYPQSKQLIDMSALVKIEGRIKIHGDQPTENEGYVFAIPEIHPAVSAFETMLRFLFPVWDTFALYGRPGKLVPDKSDIRSLMFAMPRDGVQKCGYLEVTDIANLIVGDSNKSLTEAEWRHHIKLANRDKINATQDRKSRPFSTVPARHTFHLGSSSSLPVSEMDLPPSDVPMKSPDVPMNHNRSTSESTGLMNYRGQQPILELPILGNRGYYGDPPSTDRSDSPSDDGLFQIDPAARRLQLQTNQPPPEPVPETPTNIHPPSEKPPRPLPHVDAPTDDLFIGVVPPRVERYSQDGVRPIQRSQFSGTQITQQKSLGNGNQITAPPGFALQSSHVFVRGLPPSNDENAEYEQESSNNSPPLGPVPPQYSETTPDHNPQLRSWQPTPPPSHTRSSSLGNVPFESNNEQSMSPQQSTVPGLSPQLDSEAGSSQQMTTSIPRKPVPNTPTQDDFDTANSLADFNYLIDESALERIGPSRQNAMGIDQAPPDEDTLDRKAIARLMAGESGSEYDYDEDEPDYASSVGTADVQLPKRDTEMPRIGRIKVVGTSASPPEVKPGDTYYHTTTTQKEIVVGDIHYRNNKNIEPISIPTVDFGMTYNHGRSLSADAATTLRGNSFVGSDIPQPPTPSKSSGESEAGNRPSPESHASDSDQSRRRSVAWQPGIVNLGVASPDRTSAERYVAEKAAAATAQSQSRSRYMAKRRSTGAMLSNTGTSRNISSEYLPPRPSSRGGNAAFMPHGLVSGPDLSSHLSAREQEYIARTTGSTLLQMGESQRKPPPHKAGLIGAIESRETEKRQMMSAWQRGQLPQGGLTVQQEIIRRQQQQAQREVAMRRTTPSPRPLSIQIEQGSYFSPHPLVKPQQLHMYQQQPPSAPSLYQPFVYQQNQQQQSQQQLLHQQSQQQLLHQQSQQQLLHQQSQQQLHQQVGYGIPNQPPGNQHQNNYYSGGR
jgi:CCR4-NOT transcriptional complex subunit CAF120